MSVQPLSLPEPSSSPRPPRVAPLELARLRGAVRSGLFGAPAEIPRVGRYELLRCIGRGGMGIVYAARDVELGREVAIKLLRPELSAGDDERLTSEARALARLSHPNVVSVFDVGTYEGQRFIAMEYVPGQDLRRWLEAPRPLRELLRVFVDAGRGLAAAHAVGLVHRDFKPDNVLVGDDGRPRVLDFGLARPPDDHRPGPVPALPAGADPLATVLTLAGQVVGTPAYMAPEQHLGEPADARSDQFSFAVALYHAVYGVRPFAGEDPRSLALSIVRGRIRPATPRYPVPPWLESLLARALSVDPAQRFGSMEALLAELGEHLEAGGDSETLEALPSRAFVEELALAPTHLQGGELLTLPPPVPAVAQPVAVARAAPSPAGALALPSGDEGGLTTSISTRRSLPHAASEETLEILARELDRLEGRRGKVERLGASMTWATRELEVHVDVHPEGTELLVWRRLGPMLRRRTAAWTMLGCWAAMLFIAAVAGTEVMVEALIPPFVIGSLVGGGVMGYRKAQRRHARALPSAQAQVEFIADRLSRLLGSAPPALTAGHSMGE